MVRMKLSKEEFDPKALDVKVEESTFKRYTGEIPRNGTILIARVTKMWWTQSRAGDPQIYLMAFAEQNTGELKQFNGLPIRERLTFIPDAAFRYMNFLNNFGLTTKDIFNKMDVEQEPDNIGDIINSIADWVVGSDDALCRIALVRDRYDPDELKAKVDKEGWLPLDDEDIDDDDIDDEEEDEDEPPTRPTRGRSHTTQAPARGAKAASGRTRRDESEDEDDPDDEEDDDIDDEETEAEETEDEEQDEEEQDDEDDGEAEEEPPARTRRESTRSSRSSNTKRTASTRPTSTERRGSTSASADGERTRSTTRASSSRPSTRAKRAAEDEPPF